MRFSHSPELSSSKGSCSCRGCPQSGKFAGNRSMLKRCLHRLMNIDLMLGTVASDKILLLNWAAVKELNLSYYVGETLLLVYIYPSW